MSITECPITQQIADFSGATASLDNGLLINHDDLFTFEDENFVYCAPTVNGRPITLTITFPEPLYMEMMGLFLMSMCPVFLCHMQGMAYLFHTFVIQVQLYVYYILCAAAAS